MADFHRIRTCPLSAAEKKPKRSVREWFAGELRGNTLTAKRGCTRIVVSIGDEIEEKSTRESHRNLTVNLGDRIILCGVSIDQIAMAEVRRVELDGWTARIHLSLGAGAVNDGAVHVLKTKLSAEPSRKVARIPSGAEPVIKESA